MSKWGWIKDPCDLKAKLKNFEYRKITIIFQAIGIDQQAEFVDSDGHTSVLKNCQVKFS